jgi:RimJ/RimL family protein N-acetyltransferase
MEAALERVTALEYETIYLRTFEENERAIRFYRSFGFELDGERRPFVPLEAVTVRMSRSLGTMAGS